LNSNPNTTKEEGIKIFSEKQKQNCFTSNSKAVFQNEGE
jgi:hypothetical protein